MVHLEAQPKGERCCFKLCPSQDDELARTTKVGDAPLCPSGGVSKHILHVAGMFARARGARTHWSLACVSTGRERVSFFSWCHSRSLGALELPSILSAASCYKVFQINIFHCNIISIKPLKPSEIPHYPDKQEQGSTLGQSRVIPHIWACHQHADPHKSSQ